VNLKRLIIWSIIGTGISSVTTQLLTIREFLTQFSGNEITISLVMACWLMMTGVGAFVARFWKGGGERTYAVLVLVIALWPLIQIVGIRALREVLFTHGISPGFYATLLYVLIAVSPYCLLTGFILPHSQHVLQGAGYPFDSGDLYATDSIGDIAGGAVFSFILVYWLKPFPIIALTSSLLIVIAIGLLLRQKRFLLVGASLIVCSLFYVFSVHPRVETATLLPQYGHIVRYSESPYGRIVITREGPQHTFWESGLPLYSDATVTEAEEKVHYPLSQMERPQNILLISGGLGQTLKEVHKHGPGHVDYVELDPAVTAAAESLGLMKRSPFLSIHHTDARRYLKETFIRYDAILVDLPDPDTFQLNRFFTLEFFALARRALEEGGVLCLHLDTSPNYLSEVRRKKLSSLYRTARSQFPHVLVLPGEQAYFLMSDRELNPDIPSLLKAKGIPTAYVEGFFHGNVTADRIGQVRGKLDLHEPVNADMEPRLMAIVFQEWLIRHDAAHPGWFFGAIAGLVVLYLLFVKRAEYVVFSTGFVTMGVELLVLFAFQVIYGSIYVEVGAVVTAFLVGLLPGAIAGQRWRAGLRLRITASEMVLFSLLVIFFVWVSYIRTEPHRLHFLLFCFVFSFIAGFQFPVAAAIIGEDRSPAAGLFAADLCGAAVGTLITGTLLIPLLGIRMAAVFLILVKISSMILVISDRRSPS